MKFLLALRLFVCISEIASQSGSSSAVDKSANQSKLLIYSQLNLFGKERLRFLLNYCDIFLHFIKECFGGKFLIGNVVEMS